jgi:Protein of unknown function (DUF2889)
MSDLNVIREELHFRRIDMRGYRRSDGLYEVEGRVTDRKPHDFEPLLGSKRVPAQEPLHDMGVRIVFDEQMLVHEIHTFTEAAPYAICPDGGQALQSLKGLRMTGGWSQAVRERLSGARSCTHLMQLLMPLATVAFQSLSAVRRAEPLRRAADGRPVKIDSCYAYGAGRELVREHWPEFYRPPSSDD